MAGVVIQAVPKMCLPTTAANDQHVLARSVDVSQFREITAVIRLHNGASNPIFTVDMFAEALTEEDTLNDFFASTAVATVSLNLAAVTLPSVTELAATIPFGSAVRLRTTVTTERPNSYVTLSIDVVAKS